jgi:transcriptional regulator with XRE-family HTH domain
MMTASRLPFDRVARESIRQMRGHRSQAALGRRLGFRSNVIYRWEAGFRAPTARHALRIAAISGVDVRAAIEGFVSPHRPRDAGGGWDPRDVSDWLAALVGGTTQAELAQRSGMSRTRIHRILHGDTEVSWEDLLRVIDAATRRVLDFVAAFVDPATLPSTREAWSTLEAYRRLARDYPLSEAMLALLRLDEYRRLDKHDDAWLAKRMRIDVDETRAMLRAMIDAAVVRRTRRRYEPLEDWHVEMSTVRGTTARTAPVWMRRIAELDLPRTVGSYVVFDCTKAEFEALCVLWKRAYDESRRRLRESKGGEMAGVVMCALVDLSTLDE